MAGILDTVDQRTQLVGENRLEILMFRLAGRQLFAINVFKVQEVLQLPKLTLMPQRHRFVCGVVNLRGQTLPVIDLSQAIGMRPLTPNENSTIIVTEYNRSVQAFLVGGVDRILNLNWESILPPPGGAGRQHYLTAITKVDDQIVEIIDVEKVLSEIAPMSTKVSDEKLADPLLAKAVGREVLLVDDSSVRGTTSARIIKLLRDAGAKEVHFRVSAPPFKYPCYFGTDIPDQKLLVATGRTVDQINEIIGADTLGYLSTEHVVQLAQNANCGFCTACFTGKYAVKPEEVLSTDIHERHLNDRPKNEKKLGE